MASIKPINTQWLFSCNKWLAVFFAVQAVTILILSNVHLVPLTASYLTHDPLSSAATGQHVMATATGHLFDINLTIAVALFLLIAALGHALAATVLRKRYEDNLRQKVNPLRWAEYAIGNSIMFVVVAAVCGVTNISLLIAIFGFVVIANGVGWMLERYGKADIHAHILYTIGIIASLAPWILTGSYIVGSLVSGSGVSASVYIVFMAALVLNGTTAVLLSKQYRQRLDRSKNYMSTERIYIVIAAATKTIIAWILFAGMLRP